MLNYLGHGLSGSICSGMSRIVSGLGGDGDGGGGGVGLGGVGLGGGVGGRVGFGILFPLIALVYKTCLTATLQSLLFRIVFLTYYYALFRGLYPLKCLYVLMLF